MILLDTNVLLDLFSPEADAAWSHLAMTTYREEHLVVNAVVRAEIAPRFADLGEQDLFLSDWGIETLPLDDAAAFRAGQAHHRYRRAGGERRSILADFLIGAHAFSSASRLMTRDRGRFATYFPELILITPETDND